MRGRSFGRRSGAAARPWRRSSGWRRAAIAWLPSLAVVGRASEGLLVRRTLLGEASPAGVVAVVDRQRLVGEGRPSTSGGRLPVGSADRIGISRPGGRHRHERPARPGWRRRRRLRPAGDRFDVDCLEVLLVEPRARRLAGDAQDRQQVGDGSVEASDHVGPGRAGGAEADADIAGHGPRVAVGHVRGTLDVAGQDVADAAMLAHRRIERIDGGTGHAERHPHPLLLQDPNRGLCGRHLGHRLPPVGHCTHCARIAELEIAAILSAQYSHIVEPDYPLQ